MPAQSSVHFFLNWTKERIDEMDATLASLEGKLAEMGAESHAKADQFIRDLRQKRTQFESTVRKQGEEGDVGGVMVGRYGTYRRLGTAAISLPVLAWGPAKPDLRLLAIAQELRDRAGEALARTTRNWRSSGSKRRRARRTGLNREDSTHRMRPTPFARTNAWWRDGDDPPQGRNHTPQSLRRQSPNPRAEMDDKFRLLGRAGSPLKRVPGRLIGAIENSTGLGQGGAECRPRFCSRAPGHAATIGREVRSIARLSWPRLCTQPAPHRRCTRPPAFSRATRLGSPSSAVLTTRTVPGYAPRPSQMKAIFFHVQAQAYILAQLTPALRL
jgi:hypothetical protein